LKKPLIILTVALTIAMTMPAQANTKNVARINKVPQSKSIRYVPPEPIIAPAVMEQWAKVAQCETGSNWHTRGSIYSGGLGILEINWMAYGGWIFGAEYSATPAEQVFIAIKIQRLNGLGNYVPDQNDCGHGW